MRQSDAISVYLLFEAGKRPRVAAIHAFAAAWESVFVSHDPSAQVTSDETPAKRDAALRKQATSPDAGTKVLPQAKLWVELLRDGLTFDVLGLAPGPACQRPDAEHRFDWSDLQAAADYEVLRLVAGPHLQGSERSEPVLRTMLALARDLTLFFEEIAAVIWPPSASLIGRRFFESTVTAWLDGGPFPALGLTAFVLRDKAALETVGLGLWIGQELRIEAPLAEDKVAATRLGVRLINHLIMLGGLTREERIIAPDGARLIMQPSADRTFIVVQRE